MEVDLYNFLIMINEKLDKILEAIEEEEEEEYKGESTEREYSGSEKDE